MGDLLLCSQQQEVSGLDTSNARSGDQSNPAESIYSLLDGECLAIADALHRVRGATKKDLKLMRRMDALLTTHHREKLPKPLERFEM